MSEINIRGDLNLFRVMIAIAEEGGTTGAAARLHLSQSAVSHALKRLRELLNDPVFVKNGRNLVLTPHGRSILPQVELALSTLADCTAKTGEFDPVASRMSFTLGLRDVVEYLMLPHLVTPLRESGSKLEINSKRIALDHIEEHLLSGDLDLVVDLEYPTSHKVASEEIARENLCVLVGPKHPCYDSGTIDEAEFLASDHALVVLDKRERALVENRIGGIGAKRKVVVQCEHYQAAARIAAESDLILTLPYSYAFFLQKYLDVRLLPVPFQRDPIPIRLYWRSENSNEPYIRWLVAKVKQAFRDALPSYEL